MSTILIMEAGKEETIPMQSMVGGQTNQGLIEMSITQGTTGLKASILPVWDSKDHDYDNTCLGNFWAPFLMRS